MNHHEDQDARRRGGWRWRDRADGQLRSSPAPMSPALKSWCAAQRPTYVLERETALAPITPQQGITYAEKALVLAARMNHAGCLPRIR